jgi:acetyl esterase/lipase
MPSPQAIALLDAMRAVRDSLDEVPTLEQQRAGGEMFGAMTAEPPGITSELVDAAGVPAMWVESPEVAAGAALLYLHGGGYVACSMHTHRSLVGHLATHASVRILNLDYRLAPEHPFPAALDDAVAGYRWMLDQGIAPERIGFAGDSAGGGLALAALLRLRDEGTPLPAAAFSMSAYADATCSSERYQTQADVDLLVSIESARVSWAAYTAGIADPRTPYVSPVFGDFTGLPPLLLQVGGAECLLGDSERVRDRAVSAGVDVELKTWPGLQHVFQVTAGNVPESDEALAEAGAWLRARLGLI